MDGRKYWAFSVRSTPDSVISRITNFVIKNNLREYIPFLCLEKFAKKKGTHEFLVFLSVVVDENGQISSELREGLAYAGLEHLYIEKPLTYDEIKPIVDKEAAIEAVSYARRISYKTPPVIEPINPFDFSMTDQPDSTASEPYTHLLYWMSAVGGGTWEGFREACRALGLSQVTETKHIFRRLRLLGHVEYRNGGMHWTVCPPCLVKVNGKYESEYFLSGAQVPALIGRVQNGVPVDVRANYSGPASVFMAFRSEDDAQKLVMSLQEDYPHIKFVGEAAKKLAAILPDLAGWYHAILTSIGVATDRFKLEKWDGQEFTISDELSPETGMYRFSDLANPESDIRYYYFFDGDQNCWFQGDWYGLRFLANHHLGIQAEFTYEPQLRHLYVPSVYHLPDLYERSLVLASGKLPSPVDSGLVYENIDESLIETINSKLNAQLTKGV